MHTHDGCVPEQSDTPTPPQQHTQPPPLQQRQCPHCMGMFSYSNFASHSRRCKVRLGQDISATNTELARLRELNTALRRERDDWALRYQEVKAMNDALIAKIPRPPAVVRMD